LLPPPSHLTSCTPTKSVLYFQISSTTAVTEPAQYRLLTFQVPNLVSIFFRLGRLTKESVKVRGFLRIFVNKLIFYGEELLVTRPTPKLENHPLSAVRYCLFNIFAASLHIRRPSSPFATWGSAMPWWQGTHLGDFSVKVGGEDIFKPTVGNESLHEISNDNGVRVVNFATSKNLIVKRTKFPHRNIHKFTWTSPGGKRHNQIDHILVDRGRHSSILDVRSFRSADCDTDHCPVVAKFRERLAVADTGFVWRGSTSRN
jgi:hypothetical protein